MITTIPPLTELLDAVEAAGSEYALTSSSSAIRDFSPEAEERKIAAGVAFYGAVHRLRDAIVADLAATV